MIYMFTGHLFIGPFVENELKVFSNIADKIVIIPSSISDWSRIESLPSNVEVDDRLCQIKKRKHNNKLYYFKTLFNIDFLRLLFSKYRPRTIRNLQKSLVSVNYALLVKRYISKYIHLQKDDTIYTYWLHEETLGVALYAQDNGKKFNFISRAHRYDVYEENVGTYTPCRELVFKYIDNVFVVSEAGASFLQDRYKAYKHKIEVEHLGVFKYNRSYEIAQCNDASTKLLSCSSIKAVKRVDLIYKSIVEYCLANKNKTIKWTHIGGGEGFEELMQLTNNPPENLTVSLLGNNKPSQVIEILSENKFDIFINLSLSEGIPVSIMEALSFNIPIVATDAGGNGEIVCKETGILIPIHFNSEQFSSAIDTCIDNAMIYGRTIPAFFDKNYSAEVNYSRFYKMILNNNN